MMQRMSRVCANIEQERLAALIGSAEIRVCHEYTDADLKRENIGIMHLMDAC